MPADSEQHTAFIALTKQAFAEKSYAPNDAILMASAKNLSRLQTPTRVSAHQTHHVRFDELLKRLAHV